MALRKHLRPGFEGRKLGACEGGRSTETAEHRREDSGPAEDAAMAGPIDGTRGPIKAAAAATMVLLAVMALIFAAAVEWHARAGRQVVAAVQPTASPTVPEPPPCPAKGEPGHVMWKYEAEALIGNAPAVGTNAVYFGTALQPALVYAVDCSGERRWRFDYGIGGPEHERPQGFEGSPAIADDRTIYVGDNIMRPNYLFALLPAGFPKWVYETDEVNSSMSASPALDESGRIFTGSAYSVMTGSGGRIFAFDASGKLLPGYPWDTGPIRGAPVVLTGNRVVYVADGGNRLVLETPTPSPTGPTATATITPTRTVTVTATATPTASTTPEPPLAHLRYVPVALAGSALPASQGTTGAGPEPRQQPTSSWERYPVRLHLIVDGGTPIVTEEIVGAQTASAPAVAGDVIVLGVDREGWRLVAYRVADTFEPLWDYPIGGVVAGAPILGRHDRATGALEIYYLDSGGRVVKLDASTMPGTNPEERWSTKVPAPYVGAMGAHATVIQAPALGDAGLLYVASGFDASRGEPAQVTALSRGDGTVAWTRPLPDQVVMTPVTLAPGGTLLFGAMRTLYAVATESGGLDPDAAWPSWRHDVRNTGRVAP